jgi:GSCFA family
MSDFRTAFTLSPFGIELNHATPVLCIGSCFAEHIEKKLQQSKFDTFINPFGIVYNPMSMAETLDFLCNEKKFTQKDIFQQGELWHSFLHHGHFSQLTDFQTLEKINHTLDEARFFLKKTKRIILTLGSANVFFHKKTATIVANCHKVPQQDFEKKRLSVEEITATLQTALQQIKSFSPDIEVILTVSPVRHLRDGFIENQRSKAALLLASEKLCEGLDFVHYFPAYELMMDDLREYRFYEADMIHPNAQAIAYIWQKFQTCFFSKNTQELLQEIEKITSAAQHRPFHTAAESYQVFKNKTSEAMFLLEKKYPFLDFNKERSLFL